MPKVRTPFLSTILVIILGVNLGAWTLSVATTPGTSAAPLSIPVSAAGIDAHSQSASAAVTQDIPVPMPESAQPITQEATTTQPAAPVYSAATSTEPRSAQGQ